MSATNRGAERVAFDNYPTPGWCVRRMLEVAPWGVYDNVVRSTICEPCAGEGAIVHELRKAYPRAELLASDIRDTSAACTAAGASFNRDDATKPVWGHVDFVITNPPFALWHPIAAAWLPRATWLALLLRVGAIAHLKGLPAPSLYVLPNRPSFVRTSKCIGGGNNMGGTHACGWRETSDPNTPKLVGCPQCGGKLQHSSSDSSEYAWFVWGPQTPRVEILAATPRSERT